MKKLSYIISILLQAALLMGAYMIHYFTLRKMGMVRYVIYKNQSWERDYPLVLFRIIVIIVLVLLTILALVTFIKHRKRLSKPVYYMIVMLALLVTIYVVFTMGKSPETVKAYYFISPMLALTVLIQVLKVFIGMAACKVDE